MTRAKLIIGSTTTDLAIIKYPPDGWKLHPDPEVWSRYVGLKLAVGAFIDIALDIYFAALVCRPDASESFV
ncbi:hypothetical protein ABTM48_20930, partial [Acinetobacter baumannii]